MARMEVMTRPPGQGRGSQIEDNASEAVGAALSEPPSFAGGGATCDVDEPREDDGTRLRILLCDTSAEFYSSVGDNKGKGPSSERRCSARGGLANVVQAARHDTPGRRPRYTAAVSTLSPSPLGFTLPVESRWVCFLSESFPICMVYVTKMSFLLLYIII